MMTEDYELQNRIIKDLENDIEKVEIILVSMREKLQYLKDIRRKYRYGDIVPFTLKPKETKND